VAAALVLLELVEESDSSPAQSERALFNATVKRVERWIADRAKTGFFFVDSMVEGQAPERSLSGPIVDRYMTRDRS
jgi:hypothetical protein